MLYTYIHMDEYPYCMYTYIHTYIHTYGGISILYTYIHTYGGMNMFPPVNSGKTDGVITRNMDR